MTVKAIGLDTAKHVFHVHGADASGRAVLKKRLDGIRLRISLRTRRSAWLDSNPREGRTGLA